MTEDRAITRIAVEGFASLRSVELRPGRVTVLIGPNGSGKSNLLTLLIILVAIRNKSLRWMIGQIGGASRILHYGPKTTREMRLRLEFQQDGERYAYAATLAHAAGDTLFFGDESYEAGAPETPSFRSVSLGTGHAESRLAEAARRGDSTARIVDGWLVQIRNFHFHDTSGSSALRQNSRQAEERFLNADGSNLAAFLRRLATSEAVEDVAAWKRIEALIQRIAPYIKRLEPELVDPGKPTKSAVRLRWVDERDHRFDVSDFSDGTLRALALITALSQPIHQLPAFVTIDEPELGLHPAAITLLAGLVRSVTPHCQVLLATQSPALLDEFSAEEVVVAEREDGATVLRRLDAERLQSWLEDYSLSELFDKNVLGGRP